MPRGIPRGKKNEVVENVKNEQVLEKVSKMDADSASKVLTDARVKVQEAFGSLSAHVLNHFSILKTVEDAIKLKKEELETLRDIEVKSSTLDALETEIEATRARWNQEEKDRDTEWERKETEYKYNLAQTRKRDQDLYNDQVTQRNKLFEQRESAIRAQEDELVNLRQRVAGFDEEKKSAIEEQTGKLAGKLKREFESAKALSDAQNSTEKQLLIQQVQNLKDQMVTLNTTNVKLERMVESLQNQIKEMATVSVQNNSGREFATAVTALANQSGNSTVPSGRKAS